MKRVIIYLYPVFFLAISISSFIATECYGEGEISFNDEMLEKAVKLSMAQARIQYKQDGKVSAEDCKKLSVINLPTISESYFNRKIRSLEGIENCPNLTKIHIPNQEINDLKPLSSLNNLSDLNLSENRIRDLSPLSNLVELKELDLSGNRISNLSPLSGLLKLESLDLSINSINDISSLSKLDSLTLLNLNFNKVKNLSPLTSLVKLRQLDLQANGIKDISPLAKLVNLVWLNLEANQINNISSLFKHAGLREISLGCNKIRDISPLVENEELLNNCQAYKSDDVHIGIKHCEASLYNNPLDQKALGAIEILQKKGAFNVYYGDGYECEFKLERVPMH